MSTRVMIEMRQTKNVLLISVKILVFGVVKASIRLLGLALHRIVGGRVVIVASSTVFEEYFQRYK